MDFLDKKELYHLCISKAETSLQDLNFAMAEAKSAANNDTKSSAGDKHETARAMAQLEQEKLGSQLLQTQKQLETLRKLNTQLSNKGEAGALLQCNNFYFFIAISLGKIIYKGKEIQVISPASPIGTALLNKKTGDSFVLNGKEYKVLAIT